MLDKILPYEAFWAMEFQEKLLFTDLQKTPTLNQIKYFSTIMYITGQDCHGKKQKRAGSIHAFNLKNYEEISFLKFLHKRSFEKYFCMSCTPIFICIHAEHCVQNAFQIKYFRVETGHYFFLCYSKSDFLYFDVGRLKFTY